MIGGTRLSLLNKSKPGLHCKGDATGFTEPAAPVQFCFSQQEHMFPLMLKLLIFFLGRCLFKSPAYFGIGNKIRRATQSPPIQGRSFPRKAKSCSCVSCPPCPQACSSLPQRKPGPCGGGAVCRTMRGQVWAETPPILNHLALRKTETGTGNMQR